jgi:large subunit ribosomal protein L22
MLEASAKQTYVIMSPRKLRRVLNQVRGKRVEEAMDILKFMPYDAARVVLKKLVEAVHNAHQRFNITPEHLVLSQAFADEGPSYRRVRPRAQGRMSRREKPTSHLTVVVSVQPKKEEVQ